MSSKKQEQVISRKRVVDYGEVYTAQREVNAMLDLVKQETERIDSRFLEPACGRGNFLSEILNRKLNVVKKRYFKNQIEYEKYGILAVTTIYGIDILEDNVKICRKKLYDIFKKEYEDLYKDLINEECLDSVKYVLEKNIIWGDALSLKSVCGACLPIIFSEWSFVNENKIKRREFTFEGLLDYEAYKEMPLFSDLGDDVYIPKPYKEYPLVHYLRLKDVE